MPENQTQSRAAHADFHVRSESFDEGARTVEIVYATSTPVGRRSFREILEISETAIRTDRLDTGTVHLIRDHMPWGDPLGRVISHRVEDGLAIATVRLSDSPDNAGVVADIQSGVIRSVSVGYLIHGYSDATDEATGVTTRTVTAWEPYEISLTVIPADTQAAIRSDDRMAERLDAIEAALRATLAAPHGSDPAGATVTTEDEPAATRGDQLTEEEARVPEDIAIQTAVAAERARVRDIQSMATRHGLDAAFVTQHVDAGSDLDAVRAAALDMIASSAAPDVSTATSTVRVVRDERETLVQRAEAALVSRATGEAPSDEARELRGLSLVEMARRFSGAGDSVSAARAVDEALTQRSGMHSTSDFAAVLGNTVARTLRAAYENSQRTFTPFTRTVELTDFRPVTRVALGDAPKLEKVAEGAEFTHGTIGETGESFALASYGKIVSVTRQAIINDDLSAFTRLPAMYGARAAELEADLVYGVLSGNAAMSDGKALFHAGHGNVLTGGLDVDGLSKVRALGRKQTGIDGAKINVSFITLIVHPDDETAAEKILGSIAPSASGEFNPFVGRMQIVSDPRVPEGQWFAAASPNLVDTIELGFLSGQRGIQTFTRDGWEVDGVEVKARLDVGAKAIDWRGLARATKPAQQ